MPEQDTFGLFIPTTQIWDEAEDTHELVVRLHQNINSIAIALNLKDSGYYNVGLPFVTGQQFFPNPANVNTDPSFRSTFRLVIDFGAYTGVTKTIAHGLTITNTTTFTRIYGTANYNVSGNTALWSFVALPNPTNNITVGFTNVTLTGTGLYNQVYIILEYMTS